MSLYDLIPLDPENREIRILELLPGTRQDPIVALLTKASLNDSTAFNVLSYSWGVGDDLISINVQDQEIQITRNLHQCLVNLRKETKSLTIWIDAICINQSSNSEKNTQVPFMRDIYESADQAYVWLGKGTPGLDLIVSSIRHVASQDEGFARTKLEQIGDDINATPDTILSAFSEFTSLPWFCRTWIIQEFALPRKDPVFVCGSNEISWNELRRWWRAVLVVNGGVNNHSQLAQCHPATQKLHRVIMFKPIQNLDTMRTVFTRPDVLEKGLPLSTLLSITQSALATDPRDKIYGVLGLANEMAKSSIKVDYGSPVEDLYEDVCRYLIFQENKLNILSQPLFELVPQWENSDDPKPPENISFRSRWGDKSKASWIRDFSHVHDRFEQHELLPGWHSRGMLYDASASSPPTPGPKHEKGELGIAGTEIGTVKEATRTWYMLPGYIQLFWHWENILPLWFRAAGYEDPEEAQDGKPKRYEQEWELQYHPKDGPVKTIKEAIWRTIIGDKLEAGRKSAPSFCETFFEAYMETRFKVSESDPIPNLKIPPEAATSLEEGIELFNKFQSQLLSMLSRKAAFSTENGWIGLGPDHMKKGDKVVILSGGDVPFILRPRDDHYVLVGDCYVEGVMYGEYILARAKEGKMDGRLFHIR